MKLKSEEEILNWFGERHINVTEVLLETDNRVFHSLYRKKKIICFDPLTKEYYVNKQKENNK